MKRIVEIIALLPVLLLMSCVEAESLDTDKDIDKTSKYTSYTGITYIESKLVTHQYGGHTYSINDKASKPRLLFSTEIPCPANDSPSRSNPFVSSSLIDNPNYHDEYQWFCSHVYQSEEGLPLCSVTTTSQSYSRIWDEYCSYLSCYPYYCDAPKSGYFMSRDMNTGKGDWIHLYLSTSAGYAGRYFPKPISYVYDGSTHTCFNYTFSSLMYAPITGLRLVVGHGDDDHPFIIEDGIEWNPVKGYSGCVDDFNNNGGGDWLFLYYTTNPRTGRKLMLTLPESKDTQDLVVWSDSHAGIARYVHSLFTFPFAWSEETKSLSEASTVEDIKEVIYADIDRGMAANEYGSEVANLSKKLIKDNFDFVRIYNLQDGQMVPIEEGYPANFQRGKSEYRILQSYVYITPDSPYWDRF